MKKPSRLIALILALLVLAGAVAALAAQGSQSDPLVTLSYLEQIVTPRLEQEVDAAVAANTEELQRQLDIAITSYENRVDEKLSAAGAVFARRTLAAGDKLTLSAGRELLLVSGEAVALGSLTDTTAGTLLSAGDPLTVGHLYVTTAEEAGAEATADAAVMTR